MFKKFVNFLFVLIFLIFVVFISKHYFSEKNIVLTNKSRSNYVLNLNNELILLKNDTEDIITYKDDVEEFKKKRKKRFWEKLISN